MASKGCFKWSCFGCLGSAFLVSAGFAVVGLMLAGGSAVSGRSERVDRAQALPELAAEVRSRVEEGKAKPMAEAEIDPLEGISSRSVVSPSDLPPTSELPETAIGRVTLDLGVREFFLSPGPAGQPITIDAEFDPEAFELTEQLIEQDDGSWEVVIRFETKRRLFGMVISDDHDARVEIMLPRDRPIDLAGDLGIGRAELELGGLWLGDVDLDLGTGEHIVTFSEPTAAPVDRLRLQKSVGELRVRDIGNASPRSVSVSQRIGELWVDLEGPWRNDAEVRVRSGIGSCRLGLPDGVAIDLVGGGVTIGERSVRLPDAGEIPPGAPTLLLDVEGTIGEVNVR